MSIRTRTQYKIIITQHHVKKNGKTRTVLDDDH